MLITNPRRIYHRELQILARKAKGSIKHIYLHWTAGRYGQAFDDYHLNIDERGEIYQTCNSLTEGAHLEAQYGGSRHHPLLRLWSSAEQPLAACL